MAKKYFFIKLAIVALVLVLADAGIGALLHHFYASIRTGEQGRMSYAIDAAKEEIVVLGSSRASHHYVSRILEDRLQLSCLNAGKDKQGIFYYQAMLTMMLKRYHPACIILDINPADFEKQAGGLNELAVLLPYYRAHPEIRSIINKRSKWEPVKNWSSLYACNSLLLPIVFNRFSNKTDTAAVNGYIALYREFSAPASAADSPAYAGGGTDSLYVNAFRQMAATCAANGSKLIVVISPCFLAGAKNAASIATTKTLCNSLQLPVLDYSNTPGFTANTALFADVWHLNHTGATLFSERLCSDLLSKGIIEKPSGKAPE